MELKFCPSCGQSVLDDEAQDCPFCGAAMNGSGKSARQPSGSRPQATRPGKGKPVAADDKTPPAEMAKTGAKPIAAGMKPLKPKTDEDDPFGMGAVASSGKAIQALPKPAKGVLQRVICPMCEKPGFIPRSAIGKQVRCANEKCMVPLFTAPDPNAPVVEKVPRRRALPDTEQSSETKKAKQPGSPMVIYGIIGAVVLLLGGGFAWYLNQPPVAPEDLSRPVAIPPGGYQPDESEIADTQRKDDAQKASSKAISPVQQAERLAKRMIQAARQVNNRDKAWARRLTGDVYLKTGNTAAAAQEFAQLISVNRQAGYYVVEPYLDAYWRATAAGQSNAAKTALQNAMKEAEAIPTTGRLGLETAMATASVMLVENQVAEAVALMKKMHRDETIVQNRDAMASAAWFFINGVLRAQQRDGIAVSDVFAWHHPMRTAVAAHLASRGQLTAAIQWSLSGTDQREKGDSLAVVAELAAASNLTDAELQQIIQAASTVHAVTAVRVKAIIATERKQPELLAECAAVLEPLATTSDPLAIPPIAEAVRMSVRSGDEQRSVAAAWTEFARAAIACDDQQKAEHGVRQLVQILFQIAPPTAVTRRAVQEIEKREGDVKRRIQTEMRITTETQVMSTFRNYRRKIDQLAVAAEDRRLTLMHRLVRIVRGGGVSAIQTVFADTQSGLQQEVMLDELSGLLGAAATRAGTAFTATETDVASLKVPLPSRTDALHEIRVSPLLVRAWQFSRAERLINAVRILETGSTDMPGLREAVLNEVVHFAAGQTKSPESVYKAIGAVSNPVWRETALQTAGQVFVKRGLETAAEKWLEAENRMPPTEQVSAFHALAAGLAVRSEKPDQP